MINEIVKRKYDDKWVVWSHMPCNELGMEPYSKNQIANLWAITGVFESKFEAIKHAKEIYLKYDSKDYRESFT